MNTEETLRRDRSYLHAHRLLMRAGLSMSMTFAWIFVFEYFFAFSGTVSGAFIGTIVVYALSQAIMGILTPLSAAHLRHGVKRSLMIGACVGAAAFVVLGGTFAGYFSSPQGWGIVLFGFLIGAYRALYWIPYRVQEAQASEGPNIWYELLIALMPAFAGATLTVIPFGEMRILFGAAALLILSLISIVPIRDVSERFAWDYIGTFKKLFTRRHGMLVSRAVLDGIESAALFLLWPLAVFLIVGRSYMVMGLVMSASLLVLLLLRGQYRTAMRALGIRDSALVGAAFAASGWILRLVAGNPVTVAFADSYSYVSAPHSGPDVLAAEHASDAGSYLDEFTALNEIGLAIGRIIMCAFAGILIFSTSLPIALLLSLAGAACAAGSAAYIAYQIRAAAY